ncbi:hypothetical protein CI088_11680 [Enterococcus plantarum]|uniref:HipA-like kinase domain-containing protein n=1 Tax=Enterococcus plantarum TaxID=1077675 RepID=A0A2W3YV74_9ENTE|nr:HipA family kinase [Enterococcus plantarum]PZL71736.1 hypothetical protein CI088_11680 [Enterococcus plantarum]
MAVDKHYADTHLSSIASQVGQSKPVKIKADNGKIYFLKNDIVQGTKQNACLFQELLCAQMALSLGVPVPNFAIIELEQDFIENNPDLRFSDKFKKGLYFATEQIEDVEDNLMADHDLALQNGQPRVKRAWNSFFRNIDNKEAIPNIICFDILTHNFDRFGNDGNIMVGRDSVGKRLMFAIDHGHCFGNPFYNIGKVNLLRENDKPINDYIIYYLKNLRDISGTGLSFGSVFQGLEQNIDLENGNPFIEVVTSIEAIQESEIITWLNEIPDEWVVEGQIQKNEYLNFLIRQKMNVRFIINQLALTDVFSNHRGGALDWTIRGKSHGTP